MTKLNELKEQIELDEIEAGETPEAWGDGVFEMPFSTAKALIQIAEIAFEIQEPTVRDYTLGYSVCGVCGGREIRGGFLVDHEDWCEWVRIQTLKKELQ